MLRGCGNADPSRGECRVLDGPRVLLIKRFRRHRTAAECAVCAAVGWSGPHCPGHDDAVLPGGHVEPYETVAEAAVRELREETTLAARVERIVWTGMHDDRPATYFVMADVVGRARLSGPEAETNARTTSSTTLGDGRRSPPLGAPPCGGQAAA
ncbi:NUDIX domain-containing protein [Streptomyces rimosus]|uniref:NUDIX domain-containing protein n=1 Tax=Streptomyces rimosus TaxID=1927 RepID=UPI000D14838B|nr:NUDIX domain-containing protein [Streptomyces rimosus]